MLSDQAIKKAIENCEKEQVHIPGAIQPHGFLLVISEEDFRILGVSQNLLDRMNCTADYLLNQPLTKLCAQADLDNLKEAVNTQRNVLDNTYYKTINPIGFTLNLMGMHSLMDGILHRSNHGLVLELEFLHPEDLHLKKDASYQINKTSIIRAQNAQTPQKLYQVIAEEVKNIAGFDRVMLYKFDKNYHGTIMAECKEEGMNSFLDLRFPSSDIPKQARELYLKNWLRLISNADYVPSPIVLNESLHHEPLDLSHSALRSISPVHIRYMKNMGVHASMSISLVVDGKLWGLIACHHNSPKYVSYSTRMTAEFFGQLVSLQIGNLIRMDQQHNRIIRQTIMEGILESVAEERDAYRGIMKKRQSFLELLRADGFALMTQGTLKMFGETPNDQQLDRLHQMINGSEKRSLYCTNSLIGELEVPKELVGSTSGLLAMEISSEDNSWLFWFRKEEVEHVKWGGNREKAVKKVGEDYVLEPRSSFKQWSEINKNNAKEWAEEEVELAETLQVKLQQIINQQLYKTRSAKLQKELEKQVGIRTVELMSINEQLLHEVQERMNVEEQLQKGMLELEATNKELEHFAYVASHDLQEPLRVISSFTQLLAKRYKGEIDEKADTYIDFILDGSMRMKQLIMDLLQYSRLSKKDVPDTHVDLNEVLSEVQKNLKMQIEESEAELTSDSLPVVFGNKTKLIQLFQNLVGNSIKYKEPGVHPKIRLTCKEADGKWQFSISDNGIGIHPKYADRIFVIFQRLHTKDEYTGTGIGLSLCQKIVEQHGGKIWLDQENKSGGTCFHFTIDQEREEAASEN